MLPDRCSVAEGGRPCPSPPQFVVSIVADDGEYMVGVACQRHRQAVSGKIGVLQGQGKMRDGQVRFSPVRAVGTDCIRGDADDLVQIGSGNQ